MILLYPIVLGSAVVIWGRRAGVSPGGWPWFAAWTVAGALMTFSFLTGLSIGLLLPLAGGTLLAVAWRAPGAPDAVGFFEGVGIMLLLVPLVNPDAGTTLLFTGLVIGLGAIAAYSAALAKRARSGS